MGGFWDRTAGFYDLSQRLNRRAHEAMVQAAAQWVPLGGSVLDCAAGTGALSLAAAQRARSVLCTDLSPAMLEQARSKAEKLGAANISFAQRDLFAPPGGLLFDAVIAGNVLHLLEEPGRAVESLLPALHPGGRLILPTYLLKETAPGFQAVLAAYRLLGFRPRHFWTLETYRTALGASGRLLSLQRIHGLVPVGLAVIISERKSSA